MPSEYLTRFLGAFTSDPSRGVVGDGAQTTSYVLPIVAAIIGVFLVVIIIYAIIQVYTARPKTEVKGPLELYQPASAQVINRESTKANMSGTYTLSFYLRADAVPDIRSDATPLLSWPGVWNLNYNAAHEELVWIMKQTSYGSPLVLNDTVRLSNVPMQKWMQITMGFEGRTLDLYINGQLVKSHTLTNVPPSASASISIIPGGIMGQIAYIQLWSRRLPISEVAANYVDTSDSQGRPYLGPEFFKALTNISIPNLFCPAGGCLGSQPVAKASQTWEFPYA